MPYLEGIETAIPIICLLCTNKNIILSHKYLDFIALQLSLSITRIKEYAREILFVNMKIIVPQGEKCGIVVEKKA